MEKGSPKPLDQERIKKREKDEEGKGKKSYLQNLVGINPQIPSTIEYAIEVFVSAHKK